MGCFKIFAKNLKDFILRFDLFAANATLRVRGQTSYQSIGCGAISLIMIGLFIGIFAQTIINVIIKVQVTAFTNLENQPESQESITAINFAIGIDKTSFEQIQGYFDFDLLIKSDQSPPTLVELVQCTQQIWNSYGQNLQQYYYAFKMSSMYCIPKDANLSISGSQVSEMSESISLIVSKCFNPLDSTQCKQDAQIIQFLDGIGYVPVRLLFVNNIISPQNKIPVAATVQKNIFLSFSENLGTRGQILLGKYNIQTDESIWPFSSISTQAGHYIQDFRTYTVGIQPTVNGYNPEAIRNNNYIDIEISKSTQVYNVTRTYDKLDDLLSYIGGLFSIIFMAVFFLFGSFNQYRYELLAGSSSLTYKQDKKVDQRDMGYGTYCLYSIYDWLKMFGINCSWEKMQKIDEAREEANQLLDVTYFIKKLRYLDWCISLLMQDSHRIASYIVKPMTVSESRKNRKLLEYYEKAISDELLRNSEIAHRDQQSAKKTATKKKLPVEQFRESLNKKRKHKDHQQQEKGPKTHYLVPQMSSNQIQNDNSLKNHDLNEFQDNPDEAIEQRKCCPDIQDKYDSQDEEAERIIFNEFKKIVHDKSQIGKKIEKKIPHNLKARMKAKMMIGLDYKFRKNSEGQYSMQLEDVP